MTRSYQLKQRAENQDRTRQNIIEAAIELHQAKGLAATSMSDVAERARVGKVTVYRHFPDTAALLGACSGAYFKRHPFPLPEDWLHIEDPIERLHRGLHDTYVFHRETEPMIAQVLAEARDLPVMEPYHAHWREAAGVLLAAWPRSARSDALLKAAVVLALEFDTWRLLVRKQGLSEGKAIQLMVRLTCDCETHSN